MHDCIRDALQVVAEAPHVPPANLFSSRRNRCHTGAHHFERVLLRSGVLDKPSASQCDERAGHSEAAFRFRVLIFALRSGLTLLEQIEQVRGLIVGERLAAPKPLLALIGHEQVREGWRAVRLPRLDLEAQVIGVHETLGLRARRRVGDGVVVDPVERGEEQLELQRLLRVFRQRPGRQQCLETLRNVVVCQKEFDNGI